MRLQFNTNMSIWDACTYYFAMPFIRFAYFVFTVDWSILWWFFFLLSHLFHFTECPMNCTASQWNLVYVDDMHLMGTSANWCCCICCCHQLYQFQIISKFFKLFFPIISYDEEVNVFIGFEFNSTSGTIRMREGMKENGWNRFEKEIVICKLTKKINHFHTHTSNMTLTIKANATYWLL